MLVDVAQEARRQPGAFEELVGTGFLLDAWDLPLEVGDLRDYGARW